MMPCNASGAQEGGREETGYFKRNTWSSADFSEHRRGTLDAVTSPDRGLVAPRVTYGPPIAKLLNASCR